VRHRNPDLAGPTGEGVTDEGEDCSITIRGAPVISRAEFASPVALTYDDVNATVCYSCKAGSNWKQKLLNTELRRQTRPAEVLAGGGRYCVVTNQQVPRAQKDELRSKISKVLSNRIQKKARKRLLDRIEIYDGNDLLNYIQCHGPPLSSRFREKLGIRLHAGLLDYAQWQGDVAQDRSLPDFQEDDFRHRTIAQIRAALSKKGAGQLQAFWVYGPPGTGKTRLVLQALEPFSPRVLTVEGEGNAESAIVSGEVPAIHRGVVLVVDECRAEAVEKLRSRFVSRSQSTQAALILISQGVPSPEEIPAGVVGIGTETLSPDAARRLVEAQLGIPAGQKSEAAEWILGLGESYPYFLVLVSGAVLKDPEAMQRPLKNHLWYAVRLALVGPEREHGSRAAWEKAADTACKTVLAVMLTEDVDWDGLTTKQEERLGHALQEGWARVRCESNRLKDRGVLRARQGWRYKYVSPAILTRCAVENLLQESSAAKYVREFAPELLRPLYKRVAGLGVRAEVLSRLADSELAELPCLPESLNKFSEDGLTGIQLADLVRWAPALSAAKLRCIVEAAPLEMLRDRVDVRRNLVFALQRLAHRQVSFADAEAALFRLAQAENETYSNNATGVWGGIYAAPYNLTPLPLASRFELLKRRMSESDPQRRTVALNGVRNMLTLRAFVLMPEQADKQGEVWPQPTAEEISDSLVAAWDLLIRASSDLDSGVRRVARTIAVSRLRESVQFGVGPQVLDRMTSVVSGWELAERTTLREQVEVIRKFESTKEATPLSVAIARLAETLAPSSYSERLSDSVGRMHYGREFTADRLEADKGLAREGLASGMPLVSQFDFLASESAVRAVPFMRAVGMVDEQRSALKPLSELAARSGDSPFVPLLSGYLLGMADSGHEKDVDDLLRAWRGLAAFAPVTFDASWRIGPTSERIAWVVEDLESGRLPIKYIANLAWGGWTRNARMDDLKKVLAVLAQRPEATARETALEIAVQRVESFPDEFESLRETLKVLLLALALDRPQGMAGHCWEVAAQLLLKAGESACVTDAALKLLGEGDMIGRAEPAWVAIDAAVQTDGAAVFSGIASLLERKSTATYRLMAEAAIHSLIDKFPPESVLEWVGSNEERGETIAHMCFVHSANLSPIVRGLLVRFGPRAGPARILASRAHSTPHAIMAPFSRFWQSQLENAQQWAKDKDRRVAQWASEVGKSLEERVKEERAREELEAARSALDPHMPARMDSDQEPAR
jgi:hypothetical protein